MAQELKPNQPGPGRIVDPFAEMRAEMDRMVDAMFGRGSARPFGSLAVPRSSAAMTGIMPSVDIKETDAALVMTAELPGIQEDDVHVTVRDGVLTLRGEKRSEHDETKDDMHVAERSYGSFQRAFRLPDTVDEDKIAATFDKGVLTITLPKGDNAKPEKRIAIGGA